MKAMISAFAGLCLVAVVASQAVDILNDDDVTLHHDCHSLMEAGYAKNGTYRLTINGSTHYMPCEFRDGFAFTIFLYRTDPVVNWNRDWKDYVAGFGLPLHDYFSGLGVLHPFTNAYHYALDVRFSDWSGHSFYAINGHFSVGPPASYYTLHVHGDFKGNTANEMAYNDGAQFYTYDRMDSRRCAANQHAGWWYKFCTRTLPTGRYYIGGSYKPSGTFSDGIYWASYRKTTNYSMRRFVMSLRRIVSD